MGADIRDKCDAENQFQSFDQMFRSVISVPKSEVVKADNKLKKERL